MANKNELSTTIDDNRRKKCDISPQLQSVADDISHTSTSTGEIILYQPDDDSRLEVRLKQYGSHRHKWQNYLEQAAKPSPNI